MRAGDDYLLRDAVGSVRHVTNTAGAVTASGDFTVFGEPISSLGGVFGFAGEQTDLNGLVHQHRHLIAASFTDVDLSFSLSSCNPRSAWTPNVQTYVRCW